MADPYATLGVTRAASEAEIKSSYRKLAKELHPDRNSDNPQASERFAAVTRAYDLLSDKDKRARFDRGEIDGEGNPAMPFGYGGSRGGGGNGYSARDFQGFGGGGPGAGEEVDLGDLFEGLFGRGSGARGGGPGGGSAVCPAAAPARSQYHLSPGSALHRRRHPRAPAHDPGRWQVDRTCPARRAGKRHADAAEGQGQAGQRRAG